MREVSDARVELERAQACIESHLAGLPYTSGLRPEERLDAAKLFTIETLSPEQGLRWTREAPPRMGLVVSGTVDVWLLAPGSGRPAPSRLRAGDYWNDIALLAGHASEGEVKARREARIAFLDASGLERLLRDHPSCAHPIGARVAAELKWKNDLLRGLGSFEAAGAGQWPFTFVLERKRALLRRRLSHVLRPTLSAVYARTIRDRGREPMFWVLLGLIVALIVSRAVVLFILKFGLQDKLFNLRAQEIGNPIHIHHFNYGFILAFSAGLLAFMPYFRRILRTLSFLVGFGLGLIFDEFALIVNLQPDYYQMESYYAMAILGATLILVTYFRGFFASLLFRAAALIRRRG